MKNLKIENKFIIVTISIIALYVIFLMASDIHTISNKIEQFKIEFVPLIISLVVISWFILFTRWHLLLKNLNIKIPLRDNFVIFISSFALTIIPGKVGELIKSQLLKTKFGISRTLSAPIVLIEQIYGIIGIIIIASFGIWNFKLGSYIVSIFAVLIFFILIIVSSETKFKKFLCLISKIGFLAKVIEPLSDSHKVVRQSTHGIIFVYGTLLSALFWLVDSITVYLVLLSFNVTNIELLQLIPTYTTSIILGVASFLPLGVGVVEGSLTGFLILQDVDVSVALTLVIVIRIFTRWISVSVGFIALKLSGGLLEKNNSK